MKAFRLLLLTIFIAQSWAAETNLVNLRTLDGKTYNGVRIVSTNKDSIVIKVPNQPGFIKESFTNLPPVTVAQMVIVQPKDLKPLSREEYLLSRDYLLKIENELGELDDLQPTTELSVSKRYGEIWAKCFNLRNDLSNSKHDLEMEILLPSAPSSYPDPTVQEKVRDVEEAQVREDYYSKRINEVEKAKRLLAIENKHRIIDASRLNEFANQRQARAKTIQPRLNQVNWEIEYLEVLLERASEGRQKVLAANSEKFKKLVEKEKKR